MNNPTKQQYAVEVKNLCVNYKEERILDNLNFNIKEGSIAAVIGPNGAGKTVLLKSLLNLKPFTWTGEIKIFGKSQKSHRCWHTKGHHSHCYNAGYVPQRYEFDKTFPITVTEFLKLALPEWQDKKIIETVLKEVGVQGSKNKILGNLSGGQLQRVLIARSILGEPEIIFLDEPSYGIDISGEKTFYELIRYLNQKRNITFVFVSHEMDIVYKYADQVLCLNKKLMCDGVPKEVLTAEAMKKLFGEDITTYEPK